MSGKIQFQLELGRQADAGQRGNETRRILILADCSGQEIGPGRLADRIIHAVDVDNFDEVLASIAPRLRIPLDGTPAAEVLIEFTQLDDFHPDTLFQTVTVFKALRNMRERLENPATYEAAAKELKHGLTNNLIAPLQAGETPIRRDQGSPSEKGAGESSLFGQLLGKEVGARAPSAEPPLDAIQRLIRHIVEPHLPKGADPDQQRQLLSGIDDAIAQIMRRILHHSAFQRLESVWRGIHWLITHLEDSEAVRLFLLDVSAKELQADLAEAGGQPEQTALYNLLAKTSIGIPGGEPWSLVMGDYAFGQDVESLDLLELLGAVSAGWGGIFIAAAQARLLGCSSLSATPDAVDWAMPAPELAQRWQSLRRGQAAQSIGLAFPRFLLRRPYGEKSEPIESFRFEEMPARPPHEAYLWGNSAFACAVLIAQAWRGGDEGAPGTMREIGDLPYHIYDADGGPAMQPGAEIYANEKTANAILDHGIMPILSVRQRNCVLLPRMITISLPPLALA